MWNAALMLSYKKPIPGREAKALEVFADALTLYGKLAADGKCADPEVFHHLIGGGMFIVKTENLETAHEILEMEDIRKMLEVNPNAFKSNCDRYRVKKLLAFINATITLTQ